MGLAALFGLDLSSASSGILCMLLSILSKALSIASLISLLEASINARVSAARVRLPGEEMSVSS